MAWNRHSGGSNAVWGSPRHPWEVVQPNVTSTSNDTGAEFTQTLTFVNVPVPVVSVSSGPGYGGAALARLQVSNFLIVHLASANVDLEVRSAEQADFTDGTPEGEFALGSVLFDPTRVDLDGTTTPPSGSDISVSTRFTMSEYAAEAVEVDNPRRSIVETDEDGLVTLNLNVMVDAADIVDDASTTVYASGTITIRGNR